MLGDKDASVVFKSLHRGIVIYKDKKNDHPETKKRMAVGQYIAE